MDPYRQMTTLLDSDHIAELDAVLANQGGIAPDHEAELDAMLVTGTAADKTVHDLELDAIAEQPSAVEQRREKLKEFVSKPTAANQNEISAYEPFKDDDDHETQAGIQINNATRVKGFLGNLQNPKDLLENESLVSNAWTWLQRKFFNEEDEFERDRIADKREAWAVTTGPMFDKLEELEAANEKDTPEIVDLRAQIDEVLKLQRMDIAGELDPELQDLFTKETVGQLFDAIKENPGEAGAELINALVADPFLVATPLGFTKAFAATNAKLAGKAAVIRIPTAATAGTVSAGTLGAGLETAISAGEQLEDSGTINRKELLNRAKAGGAIGAILGPSGNVLRAVPQAINKLTPKQLAKKVKDGKSLNDIADEAVNGAEGEARTAAKQAYDVVDVKTVRESGSTVGAKQATSKIGRIAELVVPRIVRVFGRKAAQKFVDSKDSLNSSISNIAAPISTRLQRISKPLANRLNRMELRRGTETNKFRARVEPFLKTAKGLSKDARNKFDLAVKNGRFKEATEILRTLRNSDDAIKQFNEVRNVFNELHELGVRAGLDIGFIDNYWARTLNDLDGFRLSQGEASELRFRKLLAKKEEDLGRTLNEAEMSDLLVHTLRRNDPDPLAQPGFTKNRTNENVTPEENVFYDSFDKSAIKYIDRIVDAIETRNFFGKAAGDTGQLNATKAINDLIENEGISFADQAELVNLLKARFVDGIKPVNRQVSGIKNVLYAITLGNPLSAATQIGDLGFALYRNGLIRGIQGVITPKKLKIEDIGIAQIAQEFSDSLRTAKYVQKIFKISAFETVDKIGKESLINGALRKAAAQVKKPKSADRFRAEHIDTYGDEIDDLIDALKRGDWQNENVKLYAWNTLAKSQPISLSEMPVRYLKHPNGRIFYMLKTFTIKQVDLIRREILREIVENPKKGMHNLVKYATYFTGLSMASDAVKDLLTGRDIDMSDAVAVNFWRNIGLSKFLVDKAVRAGPVEAALDFALTPINVGRNVSKDIWNDVNNLVDGEISGPEDIKSIRNIPVLGKLYHQIVNQEND